jgi:hypothetical protein
LRLKRLCHEGAGYAVAPLSAYHWGIVAHYTTLARQLDELERQSFAPDAVVFDNQKGVRVAVGDDTWNVDWFHFVAKRA